MNNKFCGEKTIMKNCVVVKKALDILSIIQNLYLRKKIL